jgi:hypothetical protein
MLTYLDRSEGNVLAVKASGKLARAEYETFLRRLEDLIAAHGKVRVLFELEDLQGWELGAAWDDLKFTLKHGGDVERCAVVGEKKWHEIMTKLAKPFFRVKYFDKSQLDEAWRWVLEGARTEAHV